MPWFRVDDNLAFHHKAVAVGNAALGLWVRAGSWSMQNLSDGYVPAQIALALGSKSLADRLVANRLWVEVEDGYQFHEWHDRQPTKVQVESERKAAAQRKAEWRHRRNGKGTPGVTA